MYEENVAQPCIKPISKATKERTEDVPEPIFSWNTDLLFALVLNNTRHDSSQ